MPIPTAEQLAEALAKVRCFHDMSAELIAPELLRNLLAAAPANPAERQEQEEVQRLREVLDEYERQTKALPCQHEIPERGCSTYNWRMSVIQELRAMLAASTGQEVER